MLFDMKKNCIQIIFYTVLISLIYHFELPSNYFMYMLVNFNKVWNVYNLFYLLNKQILYAQLYINVILYYTINNLFHEICIIFKSKWS